MAIYTFDLSKCVSHKATIGHTHEEVRISEQTLANIGCCRKLSVCRIQQPSLGLAYSAAIRDTYIARPVLQPTFHQILPDRITMESTNLKTEALRHISLYQARPAGPTFPMNLLQVRRDGWTTYSRCSLKTELPGSAREQVKVRRRAIDIAEGRHERA